MSIIELFPAFLLSFCSDHRFFCDSAAISASERSRPFTELDSRFFLAVISFSTIKNRPALDIDGLYMMLAVKEAMVGLLLGLIAYMMVSAVQIAGSFIDFQMGFAMANVIDPQTGAQTR